MGLVPCSVAVTRAFTEKRGLAIGIMSTGIGVGGFVLSPLIGGVFLPYLGWKGAYICIAVVTAVMIPLALVFMKRNTLATNAAMRQDHNPAATMARSNATEDLFSVSFVAIAVGFFLFLFCLVGVLQSMDMGICVDIRYRCGQLVAHDVHDCQYDIRRGHLQHRVRSGFDDLADRIGNRPPGCRFYL